MSQDVQSDVDAEVAATARTLFRYLGGEEWREYRAILAVFAGTFFAEFTPEEIATALDGTGVDPAVVPDRLERLRQWGNLTVSSSIGNPTSLDDYYLAEEPARLTDAVLALLEDHRLVALEGDDVVLLPAAWRYGIDEVADDDAVSTGQGPLPGQGTLL